jgi:recombination endonuclease VII
VPLRQRRTPEHRRKMAKPCTNCGLPALKYRKTCSDACARARIAPAGRPPLTEAQAERRRGARRNRYRFTDKPEVVARLHDQQGGKCAVCGLVRPLVLDHCHTSRTPRALLCSDCNSALGLIQEDPEVARSLVAYCELCLEHKLTTPRVDRAPKNSFTGCYAGTPRTVTACAAPGVGVTAPEI